VAAKTIPEEHREAFQKFVRLDDKLAHKFVDALKASAPRLLLGTLAKSVAPTASIDEDQARSIIMMLGSMSRARRAADKTVEEFLETVHAAAAKDGVLPVKELETQWPKARKNIAAALRTSAITVSAKAISIMASNERLMCSARIMSDLRTIFTDDIEPAAFVILHQLRLSFHEQEDFEKTRQMFVSLDRDDLIKVKTVVDRALKKHEKLKSMAKNMNVHVLDGKE
jgi:hypothetical protein